MEAAMRTVTLDDVVVVVDGSDVPQVLSVKGYPTQKITQDGYRFAASSLKIMYKSKSKKQIFAAIAQKKFNMGLYITMPDSNNTDSDVEPLQQGTTRYLKCKVPERTLLRTALSSVV